jgi:hypothetical protein
LKFRSVKSIVIAPARTGKERSKRIVVIKMDQTNKGICSIFIIKGRILIIVQMKLIAPMIEEAPAR